MDEQQTYAESLVPRLHYGWSYLRALRDGRWKYILAPKPELYDLQNDPGELKNLVSSETGRVNALRSSILKQVSRPTSPRAVSGVAPETLERLGSLGYVGPGATPGQAGIDPKDKL